MRSGKLVLVVSSAILWHGFQVRALFSGLSVNIPDCPLMYPVGSGRLELVEFMAMLGPCSQGRQLIYQGCPFTYPVGSGKLKLVGIHCHVRALSPRLSLDPLIHPEGSGIHGHARAKSPRMSVNISGLSWNIHCGVTTLVY